MPSQGRAGVHHPCGGFNSRARHKPERATIIPSSFSFEEISPNTDIGGAVELRRAVSDRERKGKAVLFYFKLKGGR